MEALPNHSQSLTFLLDEESGELQSNLIPMDGLPALDMAMLKLALTESGFGNFYLDVAALTDFIARSSEATEVLTAVIGKRRDGEFSLTLADDLMTAQLTLMPPQGGKPVGTEVMDALGEQGVVYGILYDQISTALVAGQCENLVIARGDWPQVSTPTRFDSLLADKDAELSQVDELAVVQYSDLGHLLLVNPGDRLMRRVPAVPGTNGTDIKGQVLVVESFPDILFNPNLQGAAQDLSDPDLLVATIAGQPGLGSNGVFVNPVVEVSNVDLSTGNIAFEGTIHITGDIKSGMHLNVSGDVIVSGMMEAAEINAGGNVSVKRGIVGHAGSQTDDNIQLASTAKICCKGSVQAQFMEYAHIQAGDSISIDVSALQCELVARNEVTVGKKGSRSGHIVGGRVQATNCVNAMELGSSAGVKTLVEVGFDPFLDEELAAKEQLLQRKLGEMERVLQLIAYFTKDPKKAEGGIGEKVEGTRRQLASDINILVTEQAQLNEKNVVVEQAYVKIGKAFHEGVEIWIGKHVWQVVNDFGSGTAKLHDGQVTVCK